MAVDILYVSFNRRAYAEQSFDALIRNTDWSQVERLFVQDDGSSDGTMDYLHEAVKRVPAKVELRHGPLGGPVAAMNWYLDNASEIECETCDGTGSCWRCRGTRRARVEMFAKVDNDFVVCPGWLDEMLRVASANPGVDILGIEPMIGPAVAGQADRHPEDAGHIGGKGLLRLRAFDQCRPTPGGMNGYQGFTQFQTSHPQISKAWLRPELPVFGLDQLPFEPWRSLADQYESAGWQRRWPEYHESQSDYWQWWLDEDPSRRAPVL